MKETVLILGDELIAMDLHGIIESQGLTPLGPCTSIDEVMRVARRSPPHLALIDIKLDGELGYDICAYLHWNHRTTCVYLTGNVVIAKQHQKGALGVLPKPYGAAQVVNALDYMRAHRKDQSARWSTCLLRFE